MVRRWLKKSEVTQAGWYFLAFSDVPGSRGVVRLQANMQGTELLIQTCGEALPLADSSHRAMYYGPLRNPPLTPVEFEQKQGARA